MSDTAQLDTASDAHDVGADGDLFADDPREHSTELPAYSRSTSHRGLRRLTEHKFTLDTPGGDPWLTLKLKSNAPSTKGLPVYVEGQPILGDVELRLDKPENIKAVVISVQGIVTVSYDIDERVFLEVTNVLWDASANAGQPSTSSFLRKSPNERLEGTHRWAFRISLPPRVNVTPRQARQLQIGLTERLPPNMSGRGAHATINYQILVEVKRSGTFKSNKRLSTLIGYAPRTKPNPPSELRQRAYADNTLPLGPEIDPSGWTTFSDREQRGSLFKQRDVRIEFAFSLARPLDYTRGTVIPCFLVIQSTDVHALDLLTTPQAPQVVLRRKLKATRLMATLPTAVPDDDYVDFGKASWALQPGGEEGEKHLYGEIIIPHTVTPTFSFGTFDLRYYVEVRPFTATGFTPVDDEALFRTEVTISAMHAHGPRARTFLPPAYKLPEGADGATRRLHMLLEYTDRITSIS